MYLEESAGALDYPRAWLTIATTTAECRRSSAPTADNPALNPRQPPSHVSSMPTATEAHRHLSTVVYSYEAPTTDDLHPEGRV